MTKRLQAAIAAVVDPTPEGVEAPADANPASPIPVSPQEAVIVDALFTAVAVPEPVVEVLAETEVLLGKQKIASDQKIPSTTSARSIEVVLVNPVAPVVEAPVLDEWLEAAWRDWLRSKQGDACTTVRGISIERLGAVIRSRVEAAFRAGYEARKVVGGYDD